MDWQCVHLVSLAEISVLGGLFTQFGSNGIPYLFAIHLI